MYDDYDPFHPGHDAYDNDIDEFGTDWSQTDYDADDPFSVNYDPNNDD